jgi:putative chitinase
MSELIDKIVSYPKGAKPFHRVEHKAIIRDFAIRFGIDSNKKLLYLYANIFAENGKTLLPKEEKLKYSRKRFNQVFSNRRYSSNPVTLANTVYGGRLGNYMINDGWRFRGRGFIQLTGRTNYTLVDKDIRKVLGYGFNIVKNPDNLLITSISLISALSYYHLFLKDCNTFRCFVLRITGSTRDLERRLKILKELQED